MKKYFTVVALLILSMLMASCGSSSPAGPAGGTVYTVKFQNGVYPTSAYTGCMDTGLDSLSPGTNYSGSSTFWMGLFVPTEKERYTIKYDLSSIVPSNVNVTKAYLTMKCVTTGGAASNTFTAYALTTLSNMAVSSWDYSDSAVLWGTAGGDFGAAKKSNDVMINAAGLYVFSLDTAMVKSWISSPSTNYGILIKGAAETGLESEADMYTNGNLTAANRPMLTVEYTLP